MIREEGSNYVISNDQEVAEYLLMDSDEEVNEVFVKMLSGQERMILIKNYLYYAGPRELTTTADHRESFVQWIDGQLVPFTAIHNLETLPQEWADYLITLDELVFSTPEKPSGISVEIKKIYEEVRLSDGAGEKPSLCVLIGV